MWLFFFIILAKSTNLISFRSSFILSILEGSKIRSDLGLSQPLSSLLSLGCVTSSKPLNLSVPLPEL